MFSIMSINTLNIELSSGIRCLLRRLIIQYMSDYKREKIYTLLIKKLLGSHKIIKKINFI